MHGKTIKTFIDLFISLCLSTNCLNYSLVQGHCHFRAVRILSSGKFRWSRQVIISRLRKCNDEKAAVNSVRLYIKLNFVNRFSIAIYL